ncbi:MAG: patatin-like phospholipase family protein [Bacteroidetes bacterium]|nr:patatin-like phospholipase family protein [Bacteroidota bacterium]
MSFTKRSYYLLLAALFFCLNVQKSRAQKVGVVLSGGGADGVAHIGVLKSLEENRIPIDYIVGTSMGAFVAGMYASGYSVKQIETFITSDKFKRAAEGDVEEKYVFYLKKRENDASWVSFKFAPDTILTTSLPTNFISPVPIDFTLVELFANPSAASNYNFDSLFIPFRCVGSDVTAKKQVVFKKGDVGQSIRASMSYPFYIKPILIDGDLFFDGGLYNNFPIDVLYADFKPDVIIGSSVADKLIPPDEDNVISQIKSMLINRGTVEKVPVPSIVIEPIVDDIGLFEFKSAAKVLGNGYVAANEKMDSIKMLISRRENSDSLQCRRQLFQNKKERLVFEKILIEGLKVKQAHYVRKLLSNKNKLVTLEELKPKYYRLVADDKIKQIYPLTKYNEKSGFYDLLLKIKKEKDLFVSFGGNVSSRPINAGFIGLQYNYLRKISITTSGNIYFGKLYGSYQAKLRFDFPSRLPFYAEASFTRNRWDFFKSSTAFFEESKPSFLVQNDLYGDVNLGLPAKNKGKIITGSAFANSYDKYYQTKVFSATDTADRTDLYLTSPYLFYERNTLNKKQFANRGTYFLLKARYLSGREVNTPGSTSINRNTYSRYHNWFNVHLIYDNYFKRKGNLRLGFYLEGVYSNQDFFNNYTASILAAPAFMPIPESRTLFLENFRAHSFAAGGFRSVINFYTNFDIRIEGFVYQPYREILKQPDLTAKYGEPFAQIYFIGSTSLIYHSPIGPLSFNVNYYDRKSDSFNFLFSFGYLLFNKKSTE